MAATSELRVKVKPELDPEFQALLGTATADTVTKLNTGAALVYAIYHTPKDQVEAFFAAMPQGVVKAYAAAYEAHGVGSRRGGQMNPLDVADRTDPVKVFDADTDPS